MQELSESLLGTFTERIAWISRRYHHKVSMRNLDLDNKPLYLIASAASDLLSELQRGQQSFKLIRSELNMHGQSVQELLLRLSSDLELLVKVCGSPLEVERRSRGRPDNKHVQEAVMSIAVLWRPFTGCDWVRDPRKENGEYVFEGNAFVEAAMLKIDPSLPRGTIASALKEFDLGLFRARMNDATDS